MSDAQQTTDGPVEVPPVQVYHRIRCPRCGTDKVSKHGRDRGGHVQWFRCRKCFDQETMKATVFKVAVE